MSRDLAKTIRLVDPTSHQAFVPCRTEERATGKYGFRILARGSNRASDGRTVQTESEVIDALQAGLRVRCVDLHDPSSVANAYRIGGKRRLVLEIVSE